MKVVEMTRFDNKWDCEGREDDMEVLSLGDGRMLVPSTKKGKGQGENWEGKCRVLLWRCFECLHLSLPGSPLFYYNRKTLLAMQ